MIYDTFCSRRVVDVDVSAADVVIDCKNMSGPRAIWIGGAGDIAVIPSGNAGTTANTFTCPAGTVLPVEAQTIKKTGTTATQIKLLY